MLNVLEGYDLDGDGLRAPRRTMHLMTESMKRAYADRARYLGDPDFNKDMPIARLMSKAYAADLRKTIDQRRRVEIVADDLRVAARERRDDAHLGRRRGRATRCR